MSDAGQFDKASSKNMLHLPRNIYEHIECIRPHLAKCIGEARSIENLQAYLDGYQVALAINYVEEPDHPPIGLFLSWLAETQPGAWEHGWARQLLCESGGDNKTAWGNSGCLIIPSN